jgi:cytoskeletal protein RodZ
MFVIIFQLALVIGLGMLALLLLQGRPLLTALFRSGVVLVVVLFLLAIAGKIWQISIQRREEVQKPEKEAAQDQPRQRQATRSEMASRQGRPVADSNQEVSPTTQNDDQGSDTSNP